MKRAKLPAWTYREGVGKVYLFWAESTTWFKIGYTHGPVSQRLSDIQVSSPLLIRFVCAAYGDHADEQQAHRILKHLHVRGEWFNLGGSEDLFKGLIRAFVGEHAYART